jgi:SAM-dependent methyltransferase
MSDGKAIRLDIGSKDLRYRPDYTTVDLYAPEADVQADMGELPFDDDSVSDIWASHVLEHVGPERTDAILREWLRVLMPGHVAVIVVPNLDDACRFWLRPGSGLEKARKLIFGEGAGPGDFHMNGWNPGDLDREVKAAGFEVARIYVKAETAEDNLAGSYWHDVESIVIEARKPEATE